MEMVAFFGAQTGRCWFGIYIYTNNIYAICIYIYKYIYIQRCVYIQIYTYTYIYTNTYIYIYIFMYIYIHIIYTHKYIHVDQRIAMDAFESLSAQSMINIKSTCSFTINVTNVAVAVADEFFSEGTVTIDLHQSTWW